ANNHTPVWPVAETEEDLGAAALYDAIHNGSVAAPVLAGHYPDLVAELVPVQPGDLETIAAPLDFYGVNYYNPTRVGRPGPVSASGRADGFDGDAASQVPLSIHDVEGYPRPDMAVPGVPGGLRAVPGRLARTYDLPPAHVT